MNVHAVTRPNTAGLNGLMPTVSDPDTRNDRKIVGVGGESLFCFITLLLEILFWKHNIEGIRFDLATMWALKMVRIS